MKTYHIDLTEAEANVVLDALRRARAAYKGIVGSEEHNPAGLDTMIEYQKKVKAIDCILDRAW